MPHSYHSPYSYSEARRGSGATLPLLFGCALLGFYFLFWTQQADASLPVFSGYIVAILCYLATFIEVKVGLTLMLMAIGLSPEIGSGQMADLRIEDAIIPAVFLAWITRMISRREELFPTPLKGPIFGYLFMALLSTLMGITFSNAKIDRSAIYYFKVVEYYIMFLIVLNNVRSYQDAKLMIGVSVFSAFATGLYGFFSASHLTDDERLSGPGGEGANIMGGYYAFNMVLVCALATTARSWLKRLLIVGAVVFLCIPLLRTGSRASLISLLAGFFVVIWIIFALSRRKHAAPAGGIVITIVALFLILPGLMPDQVRERFATILSLVPGSSEPLPSSFTAKTGAWTQVLYNDFLSSPIFGQGMGKNTLAHVDNEYVKVLNEVGLAGFAFFVAILVGMFKMGIRTYQVTENPLYRGYSLGYLGALTALCVHGMAAASMTTIRTMEPLMFSSGIMSAIYYLEVIRPEEDKGKRRVRPAPDHRRAYLRKERR